MSRLDYAPKLKEIQITDIKRGLGVFTPKPDRPVSFAALKAALKKAGYTLDTAEVVVAGTLGRDDKGWWLHVVPSGQRFALEGPDVEKALAGAAPGAQVEITGGWKTVGDGATAREVVSPRSVKKAEGAAAPEADAPTLRAVRFVTASFDASTADPFTGSLMGTKPAVSTEPAAPIRVTSPGLTVYKGGAVTPRLYFVEQHLGGLEVSRQILQVSVSYTPTPRLQLEAEVPLSRTSFADGVNEGAGVGLGNVTLWGKYRFFRTVKTYGDRQAAARFGLELPTGKKDAPGRREVNAHDFVRQQLAPINGGLSPHFDVSFSEEECRFIFAGIVEGL